MKKYRPLRELFVSFIIVLASLILFEYLTFDFDISSEKKIIFNVMVFVFFLFIYIIPTIFLFFNYNKYIRNRKINYNQLVENDISNIILIATKDKIKNRPSVYSLPYQMNFFYLKIDLKNKGVSIFVTSLDEYELEKWTKDNFPNIVIQKKEDFFPLIRD